MSKSYGITPPGHLADCPNIVRDIILLLLRKLLLNSKSK